MKGPNLKHQCLVLSTRHPPKPLSLGSLHNSRRNLMWAMWLLSTQGTVTRPRSSAAVSPLDDGGNERVAGRIQNHKSSSRCSRHSKGLLEQADGPRYFAPMTDACRWATCLTLHLPQWCVDLLVANSVYGWPARVSRVLKRRASDGFCRRSACCPLGLALCQCSSVMAWLGM